jgi:hypothetical protein
MTIRGPCSAILNHHLRKWNLVLVVAQITWTVLARSMTTFDQLNLTIPLDAHGRRVGGVGVKSSSSDQPVISDRK